LTTTERKLKSRKPNVEPSGTRNPYGKQLATSYEFNDELETLIG
jgi:hypothetical protein